MNLSRCANGVKGPRHPGSTCRQIDIKVYWTGAEDVALRHVALRDYLGELILGTSDTSLRYQRSVVDKVRRKLYDSAGEFRPWVIAAPMGIEQFPLEVEGYNAAYELLKRTLRTPPSACPR